MTNPNSAAQAAEKEIDTIMEQAQVFASAWAFFGGPLDQGDGQEQAEREKANLRALLSKLRAPVADERAAFDLAWKDVISHGLGSRTAAWLAWYERSKRASHAAVPPAPAARTEQATGHDRLLRALATQEAKDGIGALDALYDLAVKHGASKTAAAGFAHVANGAFAALEGQVHDEIRRRSLVALASAPVAGEAQIIGYVPPIYLEMRRRGMPVNSKIQHSPVDDATAPIYAAPQASDDDVRNAALEEAAAFLEANRTQWLSVRAAYEIRYLKRTQADKDGGQQLSGSSGKLDSADGARDVALPPLPEALSLQPGQLGHTDQTLDYFARAAVLADRQQRAGDGQVYGPYRVKWIGAGVWAGITDELPGELEGKDVFIRAALSATQTEQGERENG